MLTHKMALSLGLALALASSAQAHAEACGVITSSIKLTANCEGTMVIAANNITIDLAGFSAGTDSEDSIVMTNRSGVVIKNGTFFTRGAWLIQGGKNNALRDLNVITYDGGGRFIIDSQNTKVQRLNFDIDTDSSGVNIGGRGTTVSDSSFRIRGDSYGSPLLILGAGATAVRNTFIGGAQGAPSIFVNAGARVESNTIEWLRTNDWPPLEIIRAAIIVRGDGAVIRSNSIRGFIEQNDSYARIAGILVNGSRATIKGNQIVMSSREIPSAGIFVSPESEKNIIQRNRISGEDSPDDAGIYVLGSSSKITSNNTASVIDEGSNNIVRRNVAAPLVGATAKR